MEHGRQRHDSRRARQKEIVRERVRRRKLVRRCLGEYVYNFTLLACRPISLVLEPILKEPGDIAFTWLEIHRTKNALLQQLDLHVNASVTTGMGTPPGSTGTAGAGSHGGGIVGTGSAGVAGTGGIGTPSAAANETLNEFGFYPKESDCEYKCPEIDACIAASLWCDGKLRLQASSLKGRQHEAPEKCSNLIKQFFNFPRNFMYFSFHFLLL